MRLQPPVHLCPVFRPNCPRTLNVTPSLPPPLNSMWCQAPICGKTANQYVRQISVPAWGRSCPATLCFFLSCLLLPLQRLWTRESLSGRPRLLSVLGSLSISFSVSLSPPSPSVLACLSPRPNGNTNWRRPSRPRLVINNCES